MSDLPAVGTIYESLNRFKLDLLERAEEHDFGLNARGGVTGEDMTLGCPLRDEWYPGKPCGLKVRGRLSENGVTVLSVNDNHTCSSEHRAKKTQRARDALKARIDRLREEINEGQSTVEDEEEQEKQVTYTSRAGAKSRESSPLTSLGDSSDVDSDPEVLPTSTRAKLKETVKSGSVFRASSIPTVSRRNTVALSEASRNVKGFANSSSSSPSSSPFPQTDSFTSSSRTLVVPASRQLRFLDPSPEQQESLMLPPPLKKRKLHPVPIIKVSSASPSSTPSLFSRVSNAIRSLWPRRDDNVKPSFVKNASPPSLLLTTPTPQQPSLNVLSNSQVRNLDYSVPTQQLSYPTSQYASFLRSFGVTDVESTISNLESAGIDSLETLVLVASMEKAVIDALAKRIGEELGQLISRMGEDVEKCLNGDEL